MKKQTWKRKDRPAENDCPKNFANSNLKYRKYKTIFRVFYRNRSQKSLPNSSVATVYEGRDVEPPPLPRFKEALVDDIFACQCYTNL
jgi:hypothetical protein